MSSFLSSVAQKVQKPLTGNTTSSAAPSSGHNPLDSLPAPPELSPQIRLLLALAVKSAATNNPLVDELQDESAKAWWLQVGQEWSRSVDKMLKMDEQGLPSTVARDHVEMAAQDLFQQMSDKEREQESRKVVETLVFVSIFTPPVKSEKVASVDATAATNESIKGSEKAKKQEADVPTLSYTPSARQLLHTALHLLSISIPDNLPSIEKKLSESLFETLKQVAEQNQAEVEKARERQSHGWGGKTGRWVATGAGVIAGGVAIGITGGLAAPAIAALIPGFMTFGILTTATAPVVLGSIFGVAAGGLTGKRVSERWRGVEEFEFVDVKIGSEHVEQVAANPVLFDVDKEDERQEANEKEKSQALAGDVDALAEKRMVAQSKTQQHQPPPLPPRNNNNSLATSANETLQVSRRSAPPSPAPPIDMGDLEDRASKVSLGHADDQEQMAKDQARLLRGRPPSLLATIVVPGLLLESPTEALTDWQSRIIPESTSFSDGRDMYVLKYETTLMLKAGKEIKRWVVHKLMTYAKKEIIKRTALSAYFAAVALPLSVYGLTKMSVDNVWIQSQNKAVKAGRLLGEVLEKRVQGQRPVILIGQSLGALTVFHALMYLASLPNGAALPHIVDSAFLISLPSSPSDDEWAKCRQVVARRLVNAWSEKDLVLALVVRLHEVVSRAVTLQNGTYVAGLRPVERPGVEDIDISSVLDGHLELQEKMPEILRIIDVDA